MVKATKNELVFKVRYQQQNKYDRLREYLGLKKTNDILDRLLEGYGEQIHPNILFETAEIDFNVFTKVTDKEKTFILMR